MSEKKVEYIELIYDLIFVYLIGRSNALLHHTEGGFFSADTYFAYIASTLAILQVWYLSMLFINRYGNNGVSDHMGIFVNMYLLYYMANGIIADWHDYYIPYNIAWGLILINLCVQYYIRLRKNAGVRPWEDKHIKYHMALLGFQAAAVLVTIPIYKLTGRTLSWVTLFIGFLLMAFTAGIDSIIPVNFEHLSERVMLYVVFTFGETIVSISEYFEGGFEPNTIYFSLMAFMIVTGMFLSYGYLYNHIIDRELHTTGGLYMLIHIFLVTALNNITVALELMPLPTVSEKPKNIFLTASFLVYYVFLFLVARYARRARGFSKCLLIRAGSISLAFVLATVLTYKNGRISIAVSAVYTFAMFAMIVRSGRISKADKS